MRDVHAPHRKLCSPSVATQRPPAFSERRVAERELADGVEDDVVRLAVLREVLVEVVDDLVGAERTHELDRSCSTALIGPRGSR